MKKTYLKIVEKKKLRIFALFFLVLTFVLPWQNIQINAKICNHMEEVPTGETDSNNHPIMISVSRVESTTRTGQKFTYHPQSVCFSTMEYITYRCKLCGDTWTAERSVSSTSHQWLDRFDHYDGTYTYYNRTCLRCGCSTSYKKLGPGEITINKKPQNNSKK